MATVGPKRHRLQFQRRDVATDTFGDSRGTDVWTTIATVWGFIGTLKGEERLVADQMKAKVSHRIRVRYSSELANVTPKHRILHDGRAFDIVFVDNWQERNRELIIMVNEHL